MNRFVFLFTVLFLSAGLGEAMAQCARGPRVTDVQAALENKLVCAARTSGTDIWSEVHQPSGDLLEYAKGPGDQVDPSKVVGTWRVLNNGTDSAVVEYTYTGYAGSPYTWSLSLSEVGATTSYFFCNGTTAVARAFIDAVAPPCTRRF